MAKLLLCEYAPKGRSLPCAVIPNWESASLFPVDAMVEPWLQASGLAGRFVVLYMGNAGYGYEFQTMMDAAEQMRDDPVTFLFVGGGSHYDWLKQESRRRGLGNVVLHDYVPEKKQTASVMRTGDCALITLEDRALGVMSPSKLHAMLAMGLPILYIGPKGSNVDEALERFSCGSSIRPGQSDQVVSFIRAMIADRDALSAFRRKARMAFEQAYCDLRTLPQFDALLDQLCADRK